MSVSIALVLARAENGVIGRAGSLPWRLARDLKHYREVTMGKPIVMGRMTHESIGRPLPGRENIIISRDPDYASPGCHVVDSLDAALAFAERLAVGAGVDEICVVGGGEIYRAALGRADRIYLTEVHMAADGEVTMPAFPASDWREVSRVRLEPEPGESAAFSFVVLERRP